MNGRAARRRIARLAAALAAALPLAAPPLPAAAAPAPTLDGRLAFFADLLGIAARGGATLRLPDGTVARGDAAYVDLKTDRVLLAGAARIEHGSAARSADAIAVDLDDERVDLLDAASGASRTKRALADGTAEAIDAERFAFPDLDDRRAFIRAKRAAIVAHASVRFAPATFPSTAGAVPVPSYLYTYESGAGFGATSLGGAAFDQPYGLIGTRNALTTLDVRWIDTTGAALALQQRLVRGDDAYVAASLDAPLRGGENVRAFNGYTRLGPRTNLTVSASGTRSGWAAASALTRVFGPVIGTFSYATGSGGYASTDLGLRTPDRPLPFGATWSLLADAGYDSSMYGVPYAAPDRAAWKTVWRHGLTASIATPTVHGPLRTAFAARFDAGRTWYAYPHQRNDLHADATLSRKFAHGLSAFFTYDGDWSGDVYPTAQALFYPAGLLPAYAPDGTPWLDRAAYRGFATVRGSTLELQYAPGPSTALRLALAHHDDFPQFHGYGYPQWELRGEARLRLFPNVAVDVGRAYDFAWGGTRWVPRWTFAVTP